MVAVISIETEYLFQFPDGYLEAMKEKNTPGASQVDSDKGEEEREEASVKRGRKRKSTRGAEVGVMAIYYQTSTTSHHLKW